MSFFQRLNQGFRGAIPESQEDDNPLHGSMQHTGQQKQQQLRENDSPSSSPSPSSTSSLSLTARNETNATDGRVAEAASSSRQSAALNKLLSAVAERQESSITGGRSSSADLPSPEQCFIADMNDLTDIRKSSLQTYMPTTRRWKSFCERHKEEYKGPQGRSVYLVDSEAKVAKFLEEEVLIRTKSKRQKTTDSSGRGGSVVEVSVGPDAVKLARSSLGRIHRLQMARDEVGKLAPSDMKIFHVKIEQCQKALDEREGARPVSTRGRVYYTLSNMVTALNVLWNGQGQRKDGHSFMEMFCISATHNMLLQDEELHQINFSDCFAVVPALNQQPGAQQCVLLTFKLRNSDPTSDADQKLYVSAMRHYDLARCTFSAFAFYMFQIWQGATERDPRTERTLSDIFRDLGKDEWPSFKLLPSAGDPTVSCLPTTVWAAIKKNFRYLGITYPRKADDGCRVGTAEATKLKIPQSDIDDKGRWSVERGVFGECHVPQLLTAVPEGMAGFLDKPYSLARNGVSPPIPLQMLIFPWIEFAFGVDNAWWKQECLDEMNEVAKDYSTTTAPSTKASRKDSQVATKEDMAASRRHTRKAGGSKGKQVQRDDSNREDGNDDDEADSVQDETHDAETETDTEYVPSAYSTPASTAQEQETGGSGDENGLGDNDRQSPPATFSEANKTKASFLRLLVRCRRIILQDAAYRLHRHQPNKILDNDIFRCTMFKSFQKEIGVATDKDAALNKKRPREKSPLTISAQLQPNHAAGAQSPVEREQQQQQQQEQPAAIGEDSSTAELHHQQQEQPAATAENPSTAGYHHQQQEQPVATAESPSTAGHHHQLQEQPAVIAEDSSAAGHRHQQEEQPAAIAENPLTAGHHYQEQRHQPPALGSLDRIGGEESSTQPTSTSSYHHYQPRGQAPPSSTPTSLEQQMLQLQHMVQTWSQKQEAQMQEMFSQHMKIHELQQQMITTMMTTLRTQQSPQMQFQYPPAGPSTSAPRLPSPPRAYQPPNSVSSHAVETLGTIGDATAAPATAGTSSSKLRHPQQEMYPL